MEGRKDCSRKLSLNLATKNLPFQPTVTVKNRYSPRFGVKVIKIDAQLMSFFNINPPHAVSVVRIVAITKIGRKE